MHPRHSVKIWHGFHINMWQIPITLVGSATVFSQKRARYLPLDETDMKINQISSKLGLSDPYYFSRMFTKVMGLSPKEYRNQKKG